MYVFGPIQSRRLGLSLGINNIPHKFCSYSCIYCQIGRTAYWQVNRKPFYNPEDIVSEVKKTLITLERAQTLPEYITIVPDGEPTLDIHLGSLIEKLNRLGFPVAVITNGSLLQLPDVQQDLAHADYISIKVDSVKQRTWQRINNPARSLKLNAIVNGIYDFSKKYCGKLVTETMFINGFNNTRAEIQKIASYIGQVKPAIAYIAIPTRPPAFEKIEAANDTTLVQAYDVFTKHVAKVEFLTGYEGRVLSSTGSVEKDLLSITAVHPLREDAARDLCSQTNEPVDTLHRLIDQKLIKRLTYNGHVYYLRNFESG